MELIDRACNVCSSRDAVELFQQRFNYIHGYPNIDYIQRIVVCTKCGYTYTNPSPAPDELSVYYETMSNYENPQRQGKASRESMNKWNMVYNMIEKKASPGKVLDIGCATGNGLSIFKSKGWDVLGLDPSPNVAKIARELYGVEVITGIFDVKHFVNRGPFDVIILSSVLEHVNSPELIIADLQNILTPNGLVFIEVPNLLRPFVPFGYFTFEHLNYFTPTTLANLMEMHGYNLEEIELLDASEDIGQDYPAMLGIFKAGSPNKNNISLRSDYVAAYNTVINYEESHKNEVLRLQSRIDNITEQTIPGRLGIWGAGIHTSQLLSFTSLGNEKISCFFDNDPKKQGRFINGAQIIPLGKPEEIKKIVDGIIISSLAFENEIYKQIEYLQNYGVNIYKLYDV